MLERVKEWWNNNIEFTNNHDKLISLFETVQKKNISILLDFVI